MNRVGGAHAMHKCIDSTFGLIPNLIAHCQIACHPILIIELIKIPMVRPLTDFCGGANHLFNQCFGNLSAIAWDIGDSGPERSHGASFFLTKGVRKNNLQIVPFGGADEGQGNTCGSGGVINNRPTRFEATTGLGSFNCCFGEAIFHASRRIRPFQLCDDSTCARWNHIPKLDYWCVANCAKDVFHIVMRNP